MPNLKYQINTTKDKDNTVTIPANKDIDIQIDKFIYGYNDYKKKMKLLKFYLNPTILDNYTDKNLMIDMMTKYKINQFISHTLLLVSTTPELFTHNKLHYVVSTVLGYAFEHLGQTQPNTKSAYKSYACLLAYYKRDMICQKIYGVNKSILDMKPLDILEPILMNTKTRNIIKDINQYIKQTNVYNPEGIEASDEDKKVLNAIMELSETESDDEFESNDILDVANKVADDIVKQVIKKPDYPPPLLSPIIDDIDIPPSFSPPPPPTTTSPPPQNPSLLSKYVNNDEAIDPLTFFTGDFELLDKDDLKPLCDIIRDIRIKGGILVSKECNKYIRGDIREKVFDILPKPIFELIEKYHEYLMIAGGYLANLQIKTKSLSSDIDIFILDMSEDKYKQFKNDLINALRLMDITHKARCVQYKSVLTIISKFQQNIQFIRTDKKSFSDVTDDFDLRCCRRYAFITKRKDGGTIKTFVDNGQKNLIGFDNDKSNERSPLRILKYMAKGFKLNFNDVLNNRVNKVLDLCQNSEEIIQKCTKYCPPSVLSSNSEDEIQKNIMEHLYGDYIGNQFEKINIKKYKDFNGYYGQHKMFSKNFELVDVNNIKTKVVKTKYENTNLIVPTGNYYLPVKISSQHINIIKNGEYDDETGKAIKETQKLYVNLESYPQIVKKIKDFEMKMKDKCGLKDIEQSYSDLDKNRKIAQLEINNNGIYNKDDKKKYDMENKNIEPYTYYTFRIGFKYIFDKTDNKYRMNAFKYRLIGDMVKQGEEHDYITGNSINYADLDFKAWSNSVSHYKFIAPQKECVIPLIINGNDIKVYDNTERHGIKNDKRFRLIIKYKDNSLSKRQVKNMMDTINVMEKQLLDDNFLEKHFVSYKKFTQQKRQRITKHKNVKDIMDDDDMICCYDYISLQINEEQYNKLKDCSYSDTLTFYLELSSVYVSNVSKIIGLKFKINRPILRSSIVDKMVMIEDSDDYDSDDELIEY